MLGAALIVFRETLEAALLVGIIAAATSALPAARRWIGAGVAAGVAGAVLIALAMGQISSAFEGMGQEVLNASILACAVAMLGWHAVWMARHGAQLSADARALGESVRRGTAALSAAFVAVALAVLREGAETVLFMFGMLSGGDADPMGVAASGALGALGGVALGVLIYAGFRRVPLRTLFNVTGVLIVFLAASMAAQLARQLIQADMLPALVSTLWDTSNWLPMDSIVGTLLHALFGYEARPSAMQVLFYATVLTLLFAARALTAPPAPRPRTA
ncbi:MAG: FTR1 family iron permease [Gemmatimonadota bacterium]